MMRPTSKIRQIVCVAVITLLTASGCDSGLFMSEEELIVNARQHAANREFSAAIVQLKNAIQKNTKNPNSRFLLGEIYLNFGDFPGAEKEFNKALDNGYPIDELIVPLHMAMLAQGKFNEIIESLDSIEGLSHASVQNKRLMLARAQLGLANYDEAQRLLNAVLNEDSENSEASLGLAKLHYAKGDHKQALALVNRAIEEDPTNLDALFFLSSLELMNKNLEHAQQTLEQAVEIAEIKSSLMQQTSAKNALANIYIKRNEFDSALSLLLDKPKGIKTPPLTHYLTAVAYLSKANFDEAERYAKKVLDIAPNHTRSKLLLGSIYLNKNEYDSAITYLSDFLVAEPDHVGARKYLANAYLKSDKPNEAFAALQSTLSNLRVKADVDAYVMAADISRRIGKTDQGIALLEKGAAENPNNPRLELELARTRLASGSVQSSIGELESLLRQQPDSDAVKTLLAHAYTQANMPEKALDVVNSLSDDAQQTTDADMLRGKIYASQRDYPKAREFFQKVSSQDRANVEALFGIASTYQREQQWSLAQDVYIKVLEHDANHLQTLLNLSELEFRQGKDDAAINRLLEAKDRNPQAILPSVLLINHYLESDQIDTAKTILNDVVTRYPDDDSVRKMQGMVELAAGKPQSAISAFKNMLTRNPENADAWFHLARAYIQIDDIDAARDALKESLQHAPDSLRPTVALARIDIREGKLDDALKASQRIIAQHPKLGIGYELAGDIHFSRQAFEQASKAYQTAYESSPSANRAIKTYKSSSQLGNELAGIEFIADWIQNHPGDLPITLLIANTYQNNGKPEKANSYYEKVLLLDPNNVVALNNLAWIYLEKGSPMSVTYAKRAYQASQTYAVADTYGWALIKNGNYKSGIAKVKEALTSGGQAVPEINYHLAYGLAKSGKPDNAKQILDKLLAEHENFEGIIEARALRSSLN